MKSEKNPYALRKEETISVKMLGDSECKKKKKKKAEGTWLPGGGIESKTKELFGETSDEHKK